MTAVLAAIRSPSRTARPPPLPPYAVPAGAQPATTTTSSNSKKPPAKRTIASTSPVGGVGVGSSGNGTTTNDAATANGSNPKGVRVGVNVRTKPNSPRLDDPSSDNNTSAGVNISRTGPPPLPANVPGTPTGNAITPPSPTAPPPISMGSPPSGSGGNNASISRSLDTNSSIPYVTRLANARGNVSATATLAHSTTPSMHVTNRSLGVIPAVAVSSAVGYATTLHAPPPYDLNAAERTLHY
jgi:hypothetical protein